MNEERTIVRGFYRPEESETPIYEEDQFIPLGDEPEDQGSINLTWILWTFAIVIFLILGVTTASLTYNIINYNKIKQLEQTINNE